MFHRLTAALEFFGVLWCVVLGFLFGVCLFVCFVWFASHDFEVNLVVCEVVCEVERPSELSLARAAWEKKKIVHLGPPCTTGGAHELV